jgi:hypothetical protein
MRGDDNSANFHVLYTRPDPGFQFGGGGGGRERDKSERKF